MTLLSDANFERDVKSGISVVRFISLWDTECRIFENQFRELSQEFNKVKFIVSDINSNYALAKKEGITKVPTVIIYINGVPVARIAGSLTKRRLREQIDYFLQKYDVS